MSIFSSILVRLGVLPQKPIDSAKTSLSLKESFAALKYLPRFLGLVWQVSPTMMIADVLIRIVRAALPLAWLYTAKLITDEVVNLTQAPDAKNFERLALWIAMQFVVAVLTDALARANAWVNSLLGDKVANDTSLKIMQHAAALDLEKFEDAEFYNKLERARQQTGNRIALMAEALGQAQQAITIIVLAAGLIAFKPYLIVLLAVALVPAFLGESHFNGQSYSMMYARTPERRELDYLRYIGASDETAKEVKVFGLSEFLITRFKELSEKFYHENKSLATRRAIWGGLFATIGNAAYFGAYLPIAMDAATGKITLGDLAYFSGAFANTRALMEGIFLRFPSLVEGALYLKDLFDFFELKPTIRAPQHPKPVPKPIQKGFVFENVGFKYPRSEQWAVRHVSFTLHAGEKLALVGENGAGKTTLTKLLARLYDPTEGRILLDGIDLREFDPEALRRRIGVIFQDFIRYQMTAATNVAIGEIDARNDMLRVEHAAERSLAKSVIENLPKQYAQMIGKRFADGVELSGGEWQKIALARAYMRQADVLILDEPTAALDARAEYEVFQRFAELTQGKTAVLISHRFSTVRMADRILVMEKGELLELGSHQELLHKNGRYAELFALQAKGYQ
ncbi:MAG: ABC transporter ATP-binding protein [[Chlorobium] sp. 445]|nr:MAG: ABC transporter ATP-binding protein [[Chlorobium] sp. 445]